MEKQAAVINTVEACELLGGIDRSTLIRMIAKSEITPVRKLPGETGAYLFERAEVERAASARAAKAEAAAS